MTIPRFPELDPTALRPTRDALHAYARVLGGWLASARPRRKHWWHASLRPSLAGLTTGVVRSNVDFELELDFLASELRIRTPGHQSMKALAGQPAAEVAAWLDRTLTDSGISPALAPGDAVRGADGFPAYSAQQAALLHGAVASIAVGLEMFRAGISEETSPIQVWPHHFDLSMIWLPGNKVPGADPADEENADKQMNFGFVPGDDNVVEPYLYVTAYPLPDALPKVALPAGALWRRNGFDGALLLYEDLVAVSDPAAHLQGFWSTLLAAGHMHLATNL